MSTVKKNVFLCSFEIISVFIHFILFYSKIQKQLAINIKKSNLRTHFELIYIYLIKKYKNQ